MKFPSTILSLAALLLVSHDAAGQMQRYALTNVIFNIGVSQPGSSAGQLRYSFYALKLTAVPGSDPNKLVITNEQGFGKRYDVSPVGVVPVATDVHVVQATSAIQGPILTNVTETTFQRRVGQAWITLTNQTVAEAAFININLDDGGVIKGPFVYTYTRTQFPFRGVVLWRTNETWYGGQLFAAYDGMSGSQMIGD